MTRVQTSFLVIALALTPLPASADPILATLEGCVSVTDPRLQEAMWFAEGTFQAVAFDDDEIGCETTIEHPVVDAYIFDENRVENTLTAWLNLDNLPTCGRRQYDLHYYLSYGVLDPFGLKSLVIDTGVACSSHDALIQSSSDPSQPPPSVPEPVTITLLTTGLGYVLVRRNRRRLTARSTSRL